ncbi:MAG: GntR family transcriptional regulator [Lentisphaeria bacterium]|jgi:DNA-binding transcriptional regulator YhcF (GntR family)
MSPADLASYRDFKRSGNGGIQLAIVSYLRDKIVRGELQPGTQLPSLRELAQLWGTNFFSVKLATDALQEAGLLSKHQGRGMFVEQPQADAISQVGIYLSGTPQNRQNFIAFTTMCDLLCERLDECGIDYVIWRDHRPAAEHVTAPPTMRQAITRKRVQAVCGINVRRYDMRWFGALPIRKVFFTADRFPTPGFNDMAAELSARKRRRVAIISPEGQDCKWSFVVEGFKNAGLRIPPRRQRIFPETAYLEHNWGELGYHAAMELLTASPRPDALIVYPDNAVPGVIQAILQLGLRVPEELQTIFHRNHELPYFCPFPSMYITTSLSDMADQLFATLVGK